MAGYIAALICATITFGMALLQLSLTFGAPFGEYVLGGIHKVLPNKMRLVSGTLFCMFGLVGMIYLQSANILNIGLSSSFVKTIVIISSLFYGYAIFFNAVLTNSKKEKYVMTPFSIISFLCSMIVFFFT